MARRLREGWPVAFLWRLFRRRDEGSATITSFIVATAIFVVSSTVLIHFLTQPPGRTTGLEVVSLKTKGFEALDVLLGSPGAPSNWTDAPDGIQRLGILSQGTTLRIDADKFDAMAKGSYSNPSSTNGHIDYEEAKRAMGLSGYDFHLRVSPVFSAFDAASYGIEGMTDYHIGYVGHWPSGIESAESKLERGALTTLAPYIKYDNTTRLTLLGLGDAYKDDSSSLRSILVPLMGTQPAQTAIQGGTGSPKYDFYMVNASAYQANFNPLVRSTLSRALTLSDGSGNLGYSDGREIRAILGTANMTGLLTADLSWKEWVDTDGGTGAYDPDDYGWVEVSPNGGLTWYALTNNAIDRSKETAAGEQTDTWKARTVAISSLNCAACLGAPEVQVALHWVADNRDNVGKGWVVDDVSLSPTTTTAFSKSFERPEFDLLVVGSNVDQEAFTPEEVKAAFRDYVNIYGGRIVVLGGQTNTNWLEPLFHVGIRTASPGVSTPDTTHPLLTTPNELAWQSYNYGNKAWDFTGGGDASLFNMVVGSGASEHILSASRQGAFSSNGAEGVVMLTTYLPYAMPGDQPLRFIANALMYGRYHYLFMDFGPAVPSDVPVASVSRTAIMDKTRSADESFIEMGLVLYVWQGGALTNAASATAAPDRPWNLTAEQGIGRVYLNWTAPINNGSAQVTKYTIYRSTTPGAEITLAQVTNSTNYTAAATAGNLRFVDYNVTNGVTYYYNVTANNTFGNSPSSLEVSATPAGQATAPQDFTATGQAGLVSLTWTQPASDSGSIITGYRIYRNATGSSNMQPYSTVGNQLYYQDTTIQPTVTYTYQVAAINGAGDGVLTTSKTASPLATPSAPTVTATAYYRQVVLAWAAPANPGPAISAYTVYVGSTSNNVQFKTNLSSATLTYTHTPLNDTETWYYRVTAWNSQGESPASAVKSATTITLPGAPTLVSVSNGTTPGNLTLTWTAPADTGGAVVTGYTVWAADSSGAESNLTFVSGATTLTYTETGLGANHTRYYKVSASTLAGQGANSTELSGKSKGVPFPPTLLLVTGGPGSGKATFTIVTPTYTDGLTVLYYKVYRTANSDTLATGLLSYYGDNVASTGSGTITGLNNNQLYKFQVAAVTSAGEGNRSNVFQTTSG